jgi:hypothetical protein
MKHEHSILFLALFLAFSLAAGCGDDGGGVPADAVTISGTAFTLASGSSDASPADGVTVLAAGDFNDNGTIEAAERTTATTDADGKYTLRCPATTGHRIVVTFSLDGYAAAIKTLDVGALGTTTVDATLSEMADLSCEEGSCRDSDGAVQIQGVAIASGHAQVFNPVTDADQFPGGFADESGDMLVSAVFAAFDLRDADDNPIDTLPAGETATVRLKTPRDTWSVISDLETGNGQIDVPMYSFDETTGEWVAEGRGHLESGTGEILAEAQLASIRDGSYTDVVYSVFEAGHFSYWNVDWPISTHTCIRGRVVDGSGSPVAGVKVSVQGLTYSGTSSPQMTGADGTFCVDVMRSEAAGEDVNNNGVTGETQQVLITVVQGANGYRFGPYSLPTAQATCPDGCQDAGDLALTPANQIQVALCTVSGTVYLDGAPVEGVMVYADDDYLDSDLRDAVCDVAAGCWGFGSTDATGAFSFQTAWASVLKLVAFHTTTVDTVTMYYEGGRTFLECPADPVTINLETTYCFGAPMGLSYAGGVISWTAAVDANLLMVSSAAGDAKWYIVSDTSFPSPVTYGTVPAGAMQAVPTAGTPPPAIASGDTIVVYPINYLVPYAGEMCFPDDTFTVP